MNDLMTVKTILFKINPNEYGPQLDHKTGKFRPAKKRIWVNSNGERVEVNKNLIAYYFVD